MQSRLVTLLAVLGAVALPAAASSCGDPTALEGQFENRHDQAVLFALNGTPVTLPSALLLRNRLPVRVDANFAFDVVFDLNENDEVVVYTQREVGNQLVGGRTVGLQLLPFDYEQITKAPTSGYVYDSLLVFPANQVLIIDTVEPSCFSIFNILGPNIKAKVRIDSVNTTDRSIFVTYLVNQNCGFLSLAVGRPTQ